MTLPQPTAPATAALCVFETAEEALKWSVEVLRRRRLPRNSRLWQEMVRESAAEETAWQGPKNLMLPHDPDERLDLALKVMEALEGLKASDMRVLKLWAMGDWADDVRLRAALAIQEKMRREGVRVRMSYRYTYEQLGVAMACTKKTAWRRVQGALERLARPLQLRGVVMRVTVPANDVRPKPTGRDVRALAA